MDLKSLAQAYALTQLAHTGGHFLEAKREDIPMRMNMKEFGEEWFTPDDRKAAQVGGGGFKHQGTLTSRLLGSDIEPEARVMSGMMKLLYPLVQSKLQPNPKDSDVYQMERSGNRYVKELVGLSALVDLFKSVNPDKRWDYSFDVIDGAPGGRLDFRF